MKYLRNEKGFAMVFVLILAAISLAMTLAMLIMVSRGSYVSGQQKRFRTAVEAGRGGMEAMFQMIANRGIVGTPFPGQVLPTAGALVTKLDGPVNTWGALDNSSTIDPLVNTSYDMRIDLGAYRVYTKVVDTVEGNSGPDEGLLEASPASGSGGGNVTVVSVPFLYTIEVLSQSTTNATERSKLSVLYQY
jgi:hypothetical protein